MQRTLAFLLVTAIHVAQAAERGDAKAPSIRVTPEIVEQAVGDTPAPTQSIESDNDELFEECQDMRKRIEELRGRPLQRSALMQQFQLECQRPSR